MLTKFTVTSLGDIGVMVAVDDEEGCGEVLAKTRLSFIFSSRSSSDICILVAAHALVGFLPAMSSHQIICAACLRLLIISCF